MAPPLEITNRECSKISQIRFKVDLGENEQNLEIDKLYKQTKKTKLEARNRNLIIKIYDQNHVIKDIKEFIGKETEEVKSKIKILNTKMKKIQSLSLIHI